MLDLWKKYSKLYDWPYPGRFPSCQSWSPYILRV